MANQTAQVNLSAGRGTQPRRGGTTVRGGRAGRVSHARRGAPVRAPRPEPQDNSWSNAVMASDDARIATNHARYEEMRKDSQSRGYTCPEEDPKYYPDFQIDETYQPRGADPEGNHVWGDAVHNTHTGPTTVTTAAHPGTQESEVFQASLEEHVGETAAAEAEETGPSEDHGKGAPSAAADAGRDGELEECKGATQTVPKENRSVWGRLKDAPLWVYKALTGRG